ncbi:hypothetical protein [Staphylococcus shinii]|uniref:hypothetical protein n=1 Tax=Staphylococcus shinii TaxID=2912228 RepID=UPI003EEF6A5C
MKIYNLFWKDCYGTSWAFLGSYDSEEKAKKGMEENLKFQNLEEDEIEDYIDDYFIEEVSINKYILKEYN